jgi:RND superfamily putative drug exporter
MMKYLAFGLLLALLLDATVVRMFLVPAVMKLLGDDCWWAPKWMKRLQERLGLGETELPDERKRPAVREEDALVAAGAPLPPRPLAPHDPSHPAVEGSSRPGAATTRIQTAPARTNGPSATGTTRMRTQGPTPPAGEPQTTRIPAANSRKPRNAVNNANAAPQRTKRATPPPPVREDREIESWLGELRGNGPAVAPPPAPRHRPQKGAEPTTAIPVQNPRGGRPAHQGAEPTTAIPAQREPDPEATEKLTAQQAEEEGRRRGAVGGVSAADLLRREGRGG